MNKKLILIILLFSFSFYLFGEDESEEVKENRPSFPNTKLIVYESSSRVDTFTLDSLEGPADYFTNYQGTSIYYMDMALANRPEWNFFALLDFPFLSVQLLNRSLLMGRITLTGSFDSIFLFVGNFSDLDDNDDTDEVFFGYYLMPNFGASFRIVDSFYLKTGYMASVELYHEDGIKGEDDFVLKPNHVIHMPFFEAGYNSLETNRGIFTTATWQSGIRQNEYRWGYDEEELLPLFSFTVKNTNFFRLPITVLNKSHVEFNLENMYAYKDSFLYGTPKLMIDENRYSLLTMMNGYNERELSFDKAARFRTTLMLDFFNKEILPEDLPEEERDNKNYLGTMFNLSGYAAYNIMYFNNSGQPGEFVKGSHVINGFGSGIRFTVNPVTKRASHKLIFAADISYGFDIYNYENRFDRLQVTIGFLWSILI